MNRILTAAIIVSLLANLVLLGRLTEAEQRLEAAVRQTRTLKSQRDEAMDEASLAWRTAARNRQLLLLAVARIVELKKQAGLYTAEELRGAGGAR